jgi:hypothetical protein
MSLLGLAALAVLLIMWFALISKRRDKPVL